MAVKKIKTGVWKQKSKDGLIYLSGKTTENGAEYRITIFKNPKYTGKQGDKQPVYNVIIEIKEEENEINKIKDEERPFEEIL